MGHRGYRVACGYCCGSNIEGKIVKCVVVITVLQITCQVPGIVLNIVTAGYICRASAFPSIRMFIDVSIHQSNLPSMHPPVHPCIHPHTHPAIYHTKVLRSPRKNVCSRAPVDPPKAARSLLMMIRLMVRKRRIERMMTMNHHHHHHHHHLCDHDDDDDASYNDDDFYFAVHLLFRHRLR